MDAVELVDTHAHLGDESFNADREAVLARAAEAGVSRVIEIADAPPEWDAAIALSRARPSTVRCALGLHPYHAGEFSEDFLKKLREKIRLPEVAAVGEVGLDYVKTEISPETQRKVLERLLAAAKDWDKPVVIHCRGAYADLRAMLANIFPRPPEKGYWGVVHCFSGLTEDAEACAGLGFALGADGPITYPKNEPLRAAFRAAGLSSAVLETDSPYLPPQSARGKRNEPSAIPEIARRLAEVYGLPLEELAAATTRNARTLFGLS